MTGRRWVFNATDEYLGVTGSQPWLSGSKVMPRLANAAPGSNSALTRDDPGNQQQFGYPNSRIPAHLLYYRSEYTIVSRLRVRSCVWLRR